MADAPEFALNDVVHVRDSPDDWLVVSVFERGGEQMLRLRGHNSARTVFSRQCEKVTDGRT